MANLSDFMADIKLGRLKPVYYLTGPDSGLMTYYINQIQPKPERADSVADVLGHLTQNSFFGDKKVFVVREDRELLESKKRVEALKDIVGGTLILIYDKLGAKSHLHINFPENGVHFDHLTSQQLKKHFEQYPNISQDKIKAIIEACNRDFAMIDNEIDKMRRLPQTKGIPKHLVAEDKPFEPFKASNAIIRCDPKKTYEHLERLYTTESSILGFLSLLYGQFASAARILATNSPNEANTGLKMGVIKNLDQSFRFSYQSALDGMKLIGEHIEGIKMGQFDEKMALELCLLKIFNLP